MLPSVVRCARRGFASHAKPHVHMPETAMLTNNSTHRFERKGWEYSAYMGMLGGPIVLYLGLTNVPETDSEVFAREEALAARAGTEAIKRRDSGPVGARFAFKPSEIGEPPVLEDEE
ncbi:hypothetical protein PR003_g2190 [Phytophthora rubi]|uniref:NADH-ubiquinone oxidoreductase ESSS subunit n=1 Tax=Phytophthora rubi TaxID=129364 RepID=A0A6A3NX36_9STRA|nr:hypothetical protein PR002_g2019 [Phytophthora rubi]KAE9050678.1 hypothetical protein PR001_g2156 [Phytophthora rubi]KAE9356687.1 hypothetical protein PR003_g2190 [Phytophthora rubi]